MEASHKVRQDLIDAGLVEHTDKCNWVPVQQVTWLGFNLNFWPMFFPDGCTRAPFITEEKILHQSPHLVVTGLSGGSLFKGTPNTDLLAVRLVYPQLVKTLKSIIH